MKDWYKDAIIYEVHVRAFHDSDGDGVGDFKGLAERLEYLRDLGVTAIWLLPFFPSPLRDDGYDIADYTSVNSQYGSMRDFKAFLRKAHKLGLKVITELVLNHTSDKHPWFQRARQAKPGTKARDFYVWSDTPDKYNEVRIIFQDYESSNWTYDSVAGAYYWHRFYHHQPDLNFDNPQVRKALFKVIDFWFDMGVDGVRLDAVPYLYEREGTNCENLPETYDYLRDLRTHMDAKYDDRMLLAEANQWPEDSVAYFGDGDMCHMAFHFPIMPRLFMALRMEDRFPLIDILEQTPAIPDSCQWAVFLRNHDELTLEMVTDEERDYMYRAYAYESRMRINLGIRRRLAPLVGNNRRRIELLNGLLFSLPGTPVIYYGDEIGMGDNIFLGDRNGVRTPMQWSADRNAGFSRANPQKLYFPVIIDPEYNYETVNVEAQRGNPHSLFWWMKRVMALRKRFKAFGRGDIEFLSPDNRKVLVYVRTFEDEKILVVANLSRFTQYAELDLSEYESMIPVELFGGTEFPTIGELPYFLTLGPHSFYWFELRAQPEAAEAEAVVAVGKPPLLRVGADWTAVFRGKTAEALEEALAKRLAPAGLAGGPGRVLKSCQLVDALPVNGEKIALVMVKCEFLEADAEMRLLMLQLAEGEEAERALGESPASVLCRLKTLEGEAVLQDVDGRGAICWSMLEVIAKRKTLRGQRGKALPLRKRGFVKLSNEIKAEAPSCSLQEGSNIVVTMGEVMTLKIFRRVEPGENLELETARHLSEVGYANNPRLLGGLEYIRRGQDPVTLAVAQAHVSNQGTAQILFRDRMAQFIEHIMASHEAPPAEFTPAFHPLEQLGREDWGKALERIGAFWESALLLGRRAGELHLAMAKPSSLSGFKPEPFTKLYQRSLYQGLRSLVSRSLKRLQAERRKLTPQAQEQADRVLASSQRLDEIVNPFYGQTIPGQRIRCHGHFGLSQALASGNDFVFIDFEGDPALPLGERRIKRSPLRDMAALLVSLTRLGRSSLLGVVEAGLVAEEDVKRVEAWISGWCYWVSVAILRGYFDVVGETSLVPHTTQERITLLDALMLEADLLTMNRRLNDPGDPAEAVRAVAELVASPS